MQWSFANSLLLRKQVKITVLSCSSFLWLNFDNLPQYFHQLTKSFPLPPWPWADLQQTHRLSSNSALKLNSISGKLSSVNSSLRTNESTLDYSVNSWVWVHPHELNVNSSADRQFSLFAQTIFSFWIPFLCTEWGEMRECWMNPWVHIEFTQLTLSS